MRHLSSLLGQEWSAPLRARDIPPGAEAQPRGAGAACPPSFGPSVQLRRPAVQSPGSWRALGCTPRGCEGGELVRGGEVWSSPGPLVLGWGAPPVALIVGRAQGPELLGDRPTLWRVWPRQARLQLAATAKARSSVGGTLVRHEVTTAHTRSLFCSLQLFFSPLALMVAIPIVHKNF